MHSTSIDPAIDSWSTETASYRSTKYTYLPHSQWAIEVHTLSSAHSTAGCGWMGGVCCHACQTSTWVELNTDFTAYYIMANCLAWSSPVHNLTLLAAPLPLIWWKSLVAVVWMLITCKLSPRHRHRWMCKINNFLYSSAKKRSDTGWIEFGKVQY